MNSVSVQEFSDDPSSVFSRVEEGKTIQVTRHGELIALPLPGAGTPGRYSYLVANGLIRLKPTTTADLDHLATFPISGGVSPLEALLAERREER